MTSMNTTTLHVQGICTNCSEPVEVDHDEPVGPGSIIYAICGTCLAGRMIATHVSTYKYLDGPLCGECGASHADHDSDTHRWRAA